MSTSTNKLEAYAAARREALRTLLGTRRHAESCPSELEDSDRIEAYDVDVGMSSPTHPDIRGKVGPGDTVGVLRCGDCSGIRYLPGRVQDHIDRAIDGAP